MENGTDLHLLSEEGDEPIPTLSSLLLSTAQSLATRSPSPQPPKKGSFALPPGQPSPNLLTDTASISYLSSLLDLPLPTLQSLPSQLSTLSTSLDTDLSSLAFTRYSSFLLSHAATQSINSSFNTLSASLASLLDSTSALEAAAGAFEARVTEVRRKRERMARVRERMEEVEELLEAPSVVDACVRAGYWSEAIDVAARLAELHARLVASARGGKAGEGKGATVLLDRVREDVSLALLSLRARVLESLLQRGLKLPAAVRGIGILRRMNGGGLGLSHEEGKGDMKEEALRVVFLAARWRCLRAELESVEGQLAASGIKLGTTPGATTNGVADEGLVGAEENEERTRWIKRWIEIWREVVGETVSMYSEVFLTAPPPSTTELPPTSPLTLFLSTSLTSLSNLLNSSLPSLSSPSSLSSLLTQLSYCSHAFTRYGLEFRELHQITSLIETRVGTIVLAEFIAAGRRWEKEWRDGWESGVRRRGRERKSLASWLVVAEGVPSLLASPLPPKYEPTEPHTFHHQPPTYVSLLPPLARFLNAQATALNSLRLLPAPSLLLKLQKSQAKELERATQVLSAFVDAFLAAEESLSTKLPGHDDDEELSPEEVAAEQVRKEEKQLVIVAIKAFGRSVVPWCEAALRVGVYASDGEVVKEAKEASVLAEKLVNKLEGVSEAVVVENGVKEEKVEEKVEDDVVPAPVPVDAVPAVEAEVESIAEEAPLAVE
ncbi:intra-Golgi transport-related protein [Pseudohyphozyma bogoriensis]|nr:intra-Golgi transport-related protein [Pseudohyphozyma bogoriensis]